MREIKNTPFVYEESQQTAIEEIAKRVRALREGGRLSPAVLGVLRKYFKIKNIYHSNAIEGNKLTIGETRQVVELGLTITGKPLKDQAEAKNLSEAIDFLEDLAKGRSPIKEVDIRQIHQLVLKGIDDTNAGRYRSVEVRISGSEFTPTPPEKIRIEMQEFSNWLKETSVPESIGSPYGLLNAAVAHTWLVQIHPFIDGNGRVARLLMNLMLMRYGYPIAIITREDRARYYDALEIAQSSDLSPFIALLIESVYESLEEYEFAVQQQREQEEWAQSLASRFDAKALSRVRNEYEVWRSAMDLLRSYFRQTASLLNEEITFGAINFKEFGFLEFEKYLSLRLGESAKKTWFFRIDFHRGDTTVRYLFFFGYPSSLLKRTCDVTLHVAREEPEGSFHYERLEHIMTPNVPDLVEIGYHAKEESFAARLVNGRVSHGRIEDMGRKFFDDVIRRHFGR